MGKCFDRQTLLTCAAGKKKKLQSVGESCSDRLDGSGLPSSSCTYFQQKTATTCAYLNVRITGFELITTFIDCGRVTCSFFPRFFLLFRVLNVKLIVVTFSPSK